MDGNMKDGMGYVLTNWVWDLIDLPTEHKAIENKLVLKIKHKASESIERKACLMMKGYTQCEGVDYEKAFFSVVRFASIRMILALVAYMDLGLVKMDI